VIVKPVDLAGATINRITANNMTWMEEMGCGKGAKVEIVRSNEVIPMITKVLEKAKPTIPTHCPQCEELLVTKHRDLVCNNWNCPCRTWSTIKRVIEHSMVDGVGETTLEKLRDAFSLYSLEELKKFVRGISGIDMVDFRAVFGQSMSGLIIQTIERMKIAKYHLKDIIHFSNIPQMGEVGCANVGKGIPVQDFLNALDESYITHKWRVHVPTRPAFSNLKKSINKMKDVVEFVGRDNILDEEKVDVENAINIEMTGSFSTPKPKLLKEWAQHGVVHTTVAKAHYLICNEVKNSGKYVKAQKKGIPIITEAQFAELLVK